MPFEGFRISSLSVEPWLSDWMEEIPLRELSGACHPLSSQVVNGWHPRVGHRPGQGREIGERLVVTWLCELS
jgi:hypothetical protein